MKLAEYEMLKIDKGFAPIILLDDVFEKLDARRMHQLLERVCEPGNGQLFITDTHEDRIREHLENLSADYSLIGLKQNCNALGFKLQFIDSGSYNLQIMFGLKLYALCYELKTYL